MRALDKCNILVAYPYTTPNIISRFKEAGETMRWFIDCGAFTAWKLNKPITLDEYCTFLDGLPCKPWRYFALDVVGDPERTLENYDEMIRRGYNPVPIFTRGEDVKMLDYFYEKSDLVALGGLANTNQSAVAYVKWLWPHINGRQAHILGFSGGDKIKYFKPYSCDSSSWEAGARFGLCPIYLGNGQFGKLERTDMVNKPPEKLLSRIAAMGLDPYGLRYEESWRGDYSLSRWIGCLSYVHFMKDVQRNCGTKFFLALAADRPNLILDSYEHMTTGYWPEGSKALKWKRGAMV